MTERILFIRWTKAYQLSWTGYNLGQYSESIRIAEYNLLYLKLLRHCRYSSPYL